MTLTIKLLGGLAVEKDGSPLPKLISRKADVLLAYLAQEQRPHSRENIATLLWDDRSQKQALSNLRTLLSSLRKHAGEYVVITRTTIALNQEETVWVDTAVFQHQLALTQENWPEKQAIDQAEEALALYQGDFLDGVLVRDSFELESWMQKTRDQLRHLAVATRQKLVNAYLSQGQYGAGIQHAAILLQLDPLDESAHRQMMMLLARNGQRGAAIEQYETCRRILDEELGVEPENETETLIRRIELADGAAASNIPDPLTTFVGRTKERLQISQLLRDKDNSAGQGQSSRLLTLIGLGGIGKTRLAIQIAHDLSDSFLNGVYFVPLASLESPDFLISAIAEATGLNFTGNGDPKTQLLNHLQRKEALLVLDNFEHLLSGVRLLDELLRQAPGIKCLVTSRERLNLRAEHLFEVSGLPSPTTADDDNLNDFDSLHLFSQRAQLVDVNFKLTDSNVACVGKICHLLQGMPLGIELAAAWVRVFSCEQILAQIEQNLDFLATQMRDVPERHRSLRAIFDYVWALLLPEEQSLFVKLSLFRGGFDMAAATAVTDVSPWTLVALVEKSLLRKQENGRYEMLEVLRRFAARMSVTMTAEVVEGRVRHAAYYADFLTDQALLLNSRRTVEAHTAIAAELENVHAAWSYAVEYTDFDIAARCLPALALYYSHKGPFQEGARLMETAGIQFKTAVESNTRPEPVHYDLLAQLYIALADLENFIANYDESITAVKQAIKWGEAGQNINNQAAAYRLWSWNCSRQGEFEDAIAHAQNGLKLAQSLSNPDEEAACARVMSVALVRQGHYNQAVERAQHALELFRKTGNRWGEAKALNMLGITYWYLGDHDQSKAYYEQALPLYQEIGNREGENSVLGNLGLVATHQRNYEEGSRLYLQILHIYRQTGNRWSESWTLDCLGSLETDLVHFSQALRYFREAARLAAEAGARWVQSNALHNIGFLYWCLGEYAHADTYYQQSSAIQEETKEAHGGIVSFHDRSLLAHDQGDFEMALAYARQALEKGEASDDLYAQAESLTALGNSLIAYNEWTEAEAVYRRALPIWESLKEPHRAIDTKAGLTKIALIQENLTEALLLTDEILDYLAADSIKGILSPFGAYLVCIQVLKATNDPRADAVVAEAQGLLEETAVLIENPSLRNSYLQNVAAHRELMAL
jgi:predicted ATPase/DNA-binding SARP family transcriptional activator